MTDLDTLRAELQWCIEHTPGPRTQFALEWALSVVDELREREEKEKT